MPLADLQIDRSQIQEIEKLPGYRGVLYLSALAFNQALRSLVGDYLEKQPAAFEHWKNIAAILFKEAQIGTGTVERESIESVAN